VSRVDLSHPFFLSSNCSHCHDFLLNRPQIFAHKYTGASINLPVFAKSLPFAFIMCVVRAACIFTGSATPGYFLKQSKAMNLTIWLTLLPQGKCAVEVLSSFSRDGIP